MAALVSGTWATPPARNMYYTLSRVSGLSRAVLAHVESCLVPNGCCVGHSKVKEYLDCPSGNSWGWILCKDSYHAMTASMVLNNVQTACLGVFNGLNIPLPDAANLPAPSNEWALVLGGASSVGKIAVQLLKVAGYKVVASCSASSADVRLHRSHSRWKSRC
jgi:NADPH:quinone reductase-like Zn-dependent oxidoreductase